MHKSNVVILVFGQEYLVRQSQMAQTTVMVLPSLSSSAKLTTQEIGKNDILKIK